MIVSLDINNKVMLIVYNAIKHVKSVETLNSYSTTDEEDWES